MGTSNSSWKERHIEDGTQTIVAFQAHEDKLYIDTKVDMRTPAELTKKQQSSQPFRKDALDILGKPSGKLRWVFNWPNSMVQRQVHARFPDIKSKDVETRMKAYWQMVQYCKQFDWVMEVE